MFTCFDLLISLPALDAVTPELFLPLFFLRCKIRGRKLKLTDEAQVDDNLKTFGNFKKLSPEEMKAVTDTADALKRRVFNGCTGCRYCMPCPNGVDIPRNFRIWNTYGMYQNTGHTKWEWSTVADDQKAKNCVQCGLCETACPQHLSIREDLTRVQNMLDALK